MARQILINSTSRQTRVALVEQDELVELYIEGPANQRTLGNVCKGVVTRVLPGMQAAFVNIGLERDAFLYVMDVSSRLDELPAYLVEDEEEPAGEEVELAASPRAANGPTHSIDELLEEGQEILVQVSREPLTSKGARVTSHISLPGRFLVYMPTVSHVGVSKRIEDEAKRKGLRDLLETIRPTGQGFIVRTAGEECTEDDFRRDIDSLTKLWETIQTKAESARAPQIVHRDLDPIFRTIRDLFGEDVERLTLDSEEEYYRCVEYVDAILPQLTSRVKLHVKDTPLFDEFGVEDEVARALQRKVWLKSGGYLVIDQTEALVSIDVNTGKYVGRSNLEDTITRTNVEAARAIARQLRLRDLGGIIIIDFIDMEDEANKTRVRDVLIEELKRDRSRTSVSPFTDLGLIQMTRKRVKKSLGRTLCRACPYCGGEGTIRSPETVGYEIERALLNLVRRSDDREILIRVNPAVARFLRGDEQAFLEHLQNLYSRTLTIRSDPNLHHEQYDIVGY